jgi:vacuolar-type H+-ATPase subunit H
MPFVKKRIHLSSVDLHQKVIKSKLHLTINDHHRIITAANRTANNLINQAKIKANRIIQKANQKSEHRYLKTQHTIQGLIEKTKKDTEQIKNTTIEKTQQDIWHEANDLISKLNEAKDIYYHQHQDFLKTILFDLINALVTDIDIKTKLELIAQKLIDKAKGLEEAIIYFNQADFDTQPEIKLPLNWKILIDNDVPHQSCKLSAQGSDWYIDFKKITTDLSDFFKINTDVAG